MSERTDNTNVEEEEMTQVTEPQIDERNDQFDGAGEWDGPVEEELPPRPRNRLLAPLPLALTAVLIAATGFLGGVLVQKGNETGGSTGLPGGLPSFLSKEGGEGTGSEGAGGLPAGFPGASSGSAVSGTVSSVNGRTIYVKDSDGSTVAVRVEDGSKVSRDSSVSVKKIHPGDSVVVQGSKHGSKVKASSIAATESGVETSVPGFPVSGGSESDGEGGGSVELFGE